MRFGSRDSAICAESRGVVSKWQPSNPLIREISGMLQEAEHPGYQSAYYQSAYLLPQIT
jgi:hypothetical protein